MTPEVQAYLARGGRIRRFEDGATGNPVFVLEWIKSQGVNAHYTGHGFAQIGRRKVNIAGLFDIANTMRAAKGLEPFMIGPCKTRVHFCFNSSPQAKSRADSR